MYDIFLKHLAYITSFKDSADFSKAYVDDLLSGIDVAYKQNLKLLNEHDLADCVLHP